MEEDVEGDTGIKSNVETVGVSLDIQGYLKLQLQYYFSHSIGQFRCFNILLLLTTEFLNMKISLLIIINVIYTYRVIRRKISLCLIDNSKDCSLLKQ